MNETKTSRRSQFINPSRSAFAVLTSLVLASALLAEPQSTPKTTKATGGAATQNENAVDPKWVDRLAKEDRAAIDDNIGFAPAAIPTEDITWLPENPVTWNDLRGKVIVLQSWTTGTVAGRKWPTRLATMLKDFDSKDVRMIALHTPEDAADAVEFMKKQKPPENVSVIIDSKGEFCDGLGIFRQPVNIVIDRNGWVRYAGLNATGLQQAVAALVAETYDPKKVPPARPSAEKSESNSAAFPPFVGTVDTGKDIRGQRAPEFHIDEWLNGKPNPTGKVVVLDFWATWCGPCVASIPHMNDLAKHFGDKVCCVGISDESASDFNKGMAKLKQTKSITLSTFQYALALDPSKQMYRAINIRGIPHCIVMSKDWVVRWQGHPRSLTEAVLQQIVDADGSSGATGSAPKRRGWVKS